MPARRTGPLPSGVNRRSEALDATRGVAILLVVAFHWLGLPFGWTGVDLFFVLSGTLIGGILLDHRESQTYYQTFYGRRAFRIFPLYALFIAVMAGVGVTTLPLWRYLTFTQNFAWAATGLIGSGPTGLTWSLAVEEQFYLVLPLMVRLLSRRSLLFASTGLVLAAPLVREGLMQAIGGFAPYVLLPGRMDTLFAGVAIACLVRDPVHLAAIRRWIACLPVVAAAWLAGFLCLFLWAGFEPGSALMYRLGYSMTTLGYAAGVLWVAARERQSCGFPALSLAGVGAYSIYLFHQTVGTLVRDAVPGAFLVGLLAAAGVMAAVAALCWFGIEKRMIAVASARWAYRVSPGMTRGQ